MTETIRVAARADDAERTFVLDTSVLLSDPWALQRFAEHEVVIPLVVLTEPGELRALDDRSLNGLFVNGELVEWAALTDGDELEIGRFRLHVLEA